MKINFELTKWHVIFGCQLWCCFLWLYKFLIVKPSILWYYIPFWVAMLTLTYTIYKIDRKKQ